MSDRFLGLKRHKSITSENGRRQIQKIISSNGESVRLQLRTYGLHVCFIHLLYRLDYGEGKDLSLEECPREKLEEEKIT